MKITIDVELQENEAQYAAQIVKLLQTVSDNVTTHVRTEKAALSQALKEAVQANKTESILPELSRRLVRPDLQVACLESICSVMFDQARVESNESILPYIQLLTRLPEPVRSKARDDIVNQVLTFLSIPRRSDTPRSSLLPYGEVLAGLVKAEAISLKGTLNVLMQLIRSENTRCAGLTCLGKLMEIASDLVLERCDSVTLELLRTTLGVAQDDVYLYDIEYITEPLGWSQTQNKGAGGLVYTRSCRHHAQPLLSMAYSPIRDVVVTSSSDGNIATWDASCNLVENCTLARHYACSTDLGSHGQVMFICGVGRNPSIPPAVVYYISESSRWIEKGAIEPDAARLISVVKAVRSSSSILFACGVTGDSTTVSYYDALRNTPLREYPDHTDIVTALYTWPDRDNMLVSGSRDSTIVLYDLRIPAATQSTQLYGTVSSITGVGDFIVTGGLDKRLFLHDLRMLHQPISHRDMESAILRVCVGTHGYCAVATMTSLFTVNLNQQSLLMNKADCAGAASPRYYDIQWNVGQSLVYAGGESGTLDVYTVRPDAL